MGKTPSTFTVLLSSRLNGSIEFEVLSFFWCFSGTEKTVKLSGIFSFIQVARSHVFVTVPTTREIEIDVPPISEKQLRIADWEVVSKWTNYNGKWPSVQIKLGESEQVYDIDRDGLTRFQHIGPLPSITSLRFVTPPYCVGDNYRCSVTESSRGLSLSIHSALNETTITVVPVTGGHSVLDLGEFRQLPTDRNGQRTFGFPDNNIPLMPLWEYVPEGGGARILRGWVGPQLPSTFSGAEGQWISVESETGNGIYSITIVGPSGCENQVGTAVNQSEKRIWIPKSAKAIRFSGPNFQSQSVRFHDGTMPSQIRFDWK